MRLLDTIASEANVSDSNPTMPEEWWEESVTDLAARASRAMFYLVGAIHRAQNAARWAEDAGVEGACRLLPAFIKDFHPDAPGVLALIQEPTLRGLVTADEANRLLEGSM